MQSTLFQAAQLSDDPFLLEQVISTHVHMRHEAGIRLREKLAERREERARRRREVNSTAALQHHYLTIMRSKVHMLISSQAGDAMSWKKIREYGDVDRRMKQFESTDSCEVIDVASHFRGTALPQITDRLTSNLHAKSGVFGENSLSAKRRREKAATQSKVSRIAAQLPSLYQPKITQLDVQQAEVDFSLLSCGDTHIPLREFEGRSQDFSVDCGHRRVFYFEFLDTLKKGIGGESDYLGFQAFLQLVFHECGAEEIRLAISRWATHFGWTQGLNHATAAYIDALWRKATTVPPSTNAHLFTPQTTFTDSEDASLGDDSMNFRRRVKLDDVLRVVGESQLAIEDLKAQFDLADTDGDGWVGKREFARLLSGDLIAKDADGHPTPSTKGSGPKESIKKSLFKIPKRPSAPRSSSDRASGPKTARF